MAPPTDRQLQIAELRNKGLTQEQIADKLGIARSTVARDWSAVKAELSYLPLDYSEPTVIEPENQPDLSSSIVVSLSGPEFEKFRNSEILYSKKNQNGSISVFEPRSNNIVHSTWMRKTPAKYYPTLSKLSIKHQLDAIELMANVSNFFYQVIKTLKPIDEKDSPYDVIGALYNQKGRHHLSSVVLSKFKQKSFVLNDQAMQLHFFKQAKILWREVFDSFTAKTLDILNGFLSSNLVGDVNEQYNDANTSEVVDFILLSFEKVMNNPNSLNETKEAINALRSTLPHRFTFLHDSMIRLALLDEGIREEDLHIAIMHGISEPKYLSGFLQSGAKSTSEYDKLKRRGFETTEDVVDFDEMWEIFVELRRKGAGSFHSRRDSWPDLGHTSSNDGQILFHLRNHNWNTKRLLCATQLFNRTKERVPFEDGYLIVDAFEEIDLPNDENMAQLVNMAGMTNLLSWVLPSYNPELVQYAINSDHDLNFQHARATFEALQKKGHVFPRLGGKTRFKDSFIQKYGLGWANSDLDPEMYVSLELVRKSHGKQMPLSNLLQELQKEFNINKITGGHLTLVSAINQHLSRYCVVQPNEIVQIKGRKKQPVDTETAFEEFKEQSESMFENILKQNQNRLNTNDLARVLGVKIEQLPDFFGQVEEEEINAIRLCRVIRDDDLPQACQLVWRYFVKKVSPLKPESGDDEDDYVHDIDFASEHLGLNKSQVNLLHDVRKIRNDVEHPSTVKTPNPTWKKVAGVLKICELF